MNTPPPDTYRVRHNRNGKPNGVSPVANGKSVPSPIAPIGPNIVDDDGTCTPMTSSPPHETRGLDADCQHDIQLHSPHTLRPTHCPSPPPFEPIENELPLALLLRTIDFAATKHRCQRRKDLDQTPYINHPVAVANLLSSTGVTDMRVLQAAVLHDTVEDTHTTLEEIERAFGRDVASIVEECTDNTALSGLERKAEQLRSAPLKSREAQQVKLADKLHNLESISRSPPVGWTVRRVQAYFIWAKQVTDVCGPAHPPLARRLQQLYETAHTRVNGEFFPCHPGVCGPLTEEEKSRIDPRFAACKAGDVPCPSPIFF